jgi:hypothetical protein
MKYDCLADLAQIEEEMIIYIGIMHSMYQSLYMKIENTYMYCLK